MTKDVLISGGPDYRVLASTPAGGFEDGTVSEPLADETGWSWGLLLEPFAGKTEQPPFHLQEHSQLYESHVMSIDGWVYLREI